MIKVFKSSSTKTTRYFPPSVSVDDFLILGFLKNYICREIILLLHFKNEDTTTFTEIRNHIKKAASTTSWYLKNLRDNEIILKSKMGRHYAYTVKHPCLIDRILKTHDKLYLDNIVVNYISLADGPYPLQQTP